MLLQSKRVIYDSLGFVLGIFRVCLCDSSVKHFLFPLFFFFFFCTFLGFPSSVSVYACVCLPLSVCLCVCPFPPSSPFIYQPVFFSASIVAVIFHARMGMFPWKFRWIQQQKEWKKEEKKRKKDMAMITFSGEKKLQMSCFHLRQKRSSVPGVRSCGTKRSYKSLTVPVVFHKGWIVFHMHAALVVFDQRSRNNEFWVITPPPPESWMSWILWCSGD